MIIKMFNSFSQLYIPDKLKEAFLKRTLLEEQDIVDLTAKFLQENEKLLHQKHIIRECIDKNGYLIWKDFNLEANSYTEKKNKLLFLVCLIGTPTSHTEDNYNYTWKIKTDNTDLVNFSTTKSAIPFHTDSQFKENPEKYFVLYAMEASKFDDGLSLLIDFFQVLDELLKTEKGRYYHHVLETQLYPSLVPGIFSKNEYITYNKIIIGKSLKYRKDTICKAMNILEDHSREKIDALEFIDNVINQSVLQQEMKLEKNDMLFIDNQRILHGRTEFKDDNRTLIRVRFN